MLRDSIIESSINLPLCFNCGKLLEDPKKNLCKTCLSYFKELDKKDIK